MAVVFWESERVIDMIRKFIQDWIGRGVNDPVLTDWVARFDADKAAAARAFWDEMRAGISEAFAAGPDAVPEISPPYKAAKLDIMDKK
jgi:hypothetical protein